MGLLSMFRRKPAVAEGHVTALYGALVVQARQPAFYAALGVPDKIDGRFDLIVIHAMLVVRRLRAEAQRGAELSQLLFDYMFTDMDRSLREIGIGDMSVGKHIKKMAKAFYGRAEEYEKGLDGTATALSDALKTNLYRNAAPTPEQVAAMSKYLMNCDQTLRAAAYDDLVQGRIAWTEVR
jgi:cytochrome b pre-mRNA-processing protein 3